MLLSLLEFTYMYMFQYFIRILPQNLLSSIKADIFSYKLHLFPVNMFQSSQLKYLFENLSLQSSQLIKNQSIHGTNVMPSTASGLNLPLLQVLYFGYFFIFEVFGKAFMERHGTQRERFKIFHYLLTQTVIELSMYVLNKP